MIGLFAHNDHAQDLVVGHFVNVNRAYKLAVFHDRGAVAEFHHIMYVMLDQKDAKSLFFQLLNKFGYHLSFLWAQRSGWLVHD